MKPRSAWQRVILIVADPNLAHCFRTISSAVLDLLRLAMLAAHSRRALAAENLFLRKQPALFHPPDDGHPQPHVPLGVRRW